MDPNLSYGRVSHCESNTDQLRETSSWEFSHLHINQISQLPENLSIYAWLR